MASNRAKVIGIDAGMASIHGKSNELMISTCPDSSDGRALDI